MGGRTSLKCAWAKPPLLLAEYALMNRDIGINRLVIVCPNSYKADWKNEIARYGLTMPVLAYETSDDRSTQEFLKRYEREEFAIVLNFESTIYEKTKSLLKRLVNRRTLFVVDESIKIKNPEALTTKAIVQASLQADYVRILTGLPMTQGPHDLFSQLRLVRGVMGFNFFSFRNTFCKMGGV